MSGRKSVDPGLDLPAVPGQERLAASRVLGLGGLGSPAATYLAGAGVGRLVLVDPDKVDLSNLHRQILHRSAGVGLAKVGSAKPCAAWISSWTVPTTSGRASN